MVRWSDWCVGRTSPFTDRSVCRRRDRIARWHLKKLDECARYRTSRDMAGDSSLRGTDADKRTDYYARALANQRHPYEPRGHEGVWRLYVGVLGQDIGYVR